MDKLYDHKIEACCLFEYDKDSSLIWERCSLRWERVAATKVQDECNYFPKVNIENQDLPVDSTRLWIHRSASREVRMHCTCSSAFYRRSPNQNLVLLYYLVASKDSLLAVRTEIPDVLTYDPANYQIEYYSGNSLVGNFLIVNITDPVGDLPLYSSANSRALPHSLNSFDSRKTDNNRLKIEDSVDYSFASSALNFVVLVRAEAEERQLLVKSLVDRSRDSERNVILVTSLDSLDLAASGRHTVLSDCNSGADSNPRLDSCANLGNASTLVTELDNLDNLTVSCVADFVDAVGNNS